MKHYQFLSLSKIIHAKINALFITHEHTTKRFSYEGYTLAKDLTPKEAKEEGRVGLYTTKDDAKVIIKSHGFSLFDMDYMFLLNEASILQLLQKSLHGMNAKIQIPKLREVIQEKNRIAVVSEVISGIEISQVEQAVQVTSITACLNFLSDVTKIIPKKIIKNSITKDKQYMLLYFPVYVIKVIMGNPGEISLLVTVLLQFYRKLLRNIFLNEQIILAHCELHADSILYDKTTKQVSLIDWESAIFADKFYDLSIVARLYLQNFGQENMIDFIQNFLQDKHDQSWFSLVAIFSCIEFWAYDTTNKNTRVQSKNFLEFISHLEKTNTPGNTISLLEKITMLLLNTLSFFYGVFPFLQKYVNKKIILCYHSIGNTSWRYASSIDIFEKQIQYLMKFYSIVSVTDVLNTNEKSPQVAITFDDGYADVYTNAFPILEKYGVKATVFVLGESATVNRTEVANSLDFLRIEQMQKLHQKGWEIGYHTKTHENLEELSQEQLVDQIIIGKAKLEKELGFTLDYFAYPRGKYNKKVIALVKQAGFKAAFTVDGGSYSKKDIFLVPRTSTEDIYTVKQFSAFISPMGLLLTEILMRIIRIKTSMFKK